MPSLASLCAPLVCLCLLTAACSTPISPYSPLEDFEDDEPFDAGLTPVQDAGARDAGRRDAGMPDSGTGASANCMRIATTNIFGNFLDSDCASRIPQPCAGPEQSVQQAVNQRVANIARECGAPVDAAIGVAFGRGGCPFTYGYSRALQGRVWSCIEAELETLRLACTLTCALTGPLSR